jgi:hypothetical protein
MTSIEWLIKELRIEMGCGKDLCKSYQGVYEEIINEAKAMEKEQMITFGESVCQDGFEEYVAETFDKKYGGEK